MEGSTLHAAVASTGIAAGDHSRSRVDVADRSARLASAMAARGVGEGDAVAVLLRNDIIFIEAVQAIQRLGAYSVPVNWHFKGQEILHVLADSGARLLIGHADLMRPLAGFLNPGIVCLGVETPPAIASAYRVSAADAAVPDWAEDVERAIASHGSYAGEARQQPQTMIYTSGTTGNPKGVRRDSPTPEQRAATDRLREIVYGLRPGVRAVLPGPLYHSAPGFFAMRAAAVGDRLVLMPRFDAEAMLAIIEAERIEVVFMVPTMFVRLLNLPQEIRERYDLSSLRHVIHASAPCPPSVKRAMIDWWGPVINEFYGSTEAGTVTFCTSADALRKPGSVGRPVPDAELRFYGDDGTLLAPGAIGEIYTRIRTAPDFTYHNLPSEREKIGRDGFITSGDVGYIDDEGYVFICDRRKDMVISGGVNIYPAEIEAALLGMDGVQDCAVFGIPDAEFGEALMAFVEPRAGALLSGEHLRLALKSVLAGHKIPRFIEIAGELPREDSGKIFKRRLREPYWREAGRVI